MIVPQIVDDLYAGTMDQAAWNRAFIGIADVVRASATLLLAFDPATGAPLREENHRLDPGVLNNYRRYWDVQGLSTRVIRSQAELVRRVLSGPSAYAPTTS